MKYNRNAFRDSLSTIGNYLDNVMNSKLDANCSNKVVLYLYRPVNHQMCLTKWEYSGNNYYEFYSNDSDLLGSNVSSSSSGTNENETSKTSTNSQIYNKYTSVSNNSSDTSSTSQNTNSGVSIEIMVNLVFHQMTQHQHLQPPQILLVLHLQRKNHLLIIPGSELDQQYNNSSATQVDNSKYSYNNAPTTIKVYSM